METFMYAHGKGVNVRGRATMPPNLKWLGALESSGFCRAVQVPHYKVYLGARYIDGDDWATVETLMKTRSKEMPPL